MSQCAAGSDSSSLSGAQQPRTHGRVRRGNRWIPARSRTHPNPRPPAQDERGPGEAFVLPALAAGVDRAERGRRARRRPDKHHHDQAGQQPQPPSPHRTASPPGRPRAAAHASPLVRRSLPGPSVRLHSAGHVAASFKSGEPEHLPHLDHGIESLMRTATKDHPSARRACSTWCRLSDHRTAPRCRTACHATPTTSARALQRRQRPPPMHHRPGVGVVYLGRARRASTSSRTEVSPGHFPRSRRVWGRAGTSCRRSSRSRMRRARCR